MIIILMMIIMLKQFLLLNIFVETVLIFLIGLFDEGKVQKNRIEKKFKSFVTLETFTATYEYFNAPLLNKSITSTYNLT